MIKDRLSLYADAETQGGVVDAHGGPLLLAHRAMRHRGGVVDHASGDEHNAFWALGVIKDWQ